MSVNKRLRKIVSSTEAATDTREQSPSTPEKKHLDRDFSKEIKQLCDIENISRENLEHYDESERRGDSEIVAAEVSLARAVSPLLKIKAEPVHIPAPKVLKFKDPQLQMRPKSVGLPPLLFVVFLGLLILLVYLLLMEIA